MAGTLRLATTADAEQIAAIYEHFVVNTPTSFELEPPSVEETSRRISDILEMYPWLVFEEDGVVAGYAYASQHRARYHYQWSVDVSVYVHEAYRRRGIGATIYSALLAMLPLQGYVAAFAGITLPNAGSVGLHETLGFERVGVYKNVGYKLGAWHSVGWWQRALTTATTEPRRPVPLKEVQGLPEWNQCLALALPFMPRAASSSRTDSEGDQEELAAQTLASFKICRGEVNHEYGVLANRLTSYITSQAFLVSGYAISMGNMTAPAGTTFRLWFPLLLCLVGLLLTFRADPGIAGVCKVIEQWHQRQDELFSRGVGLEDFGVLQHQGVKTIHDNNLRFAQTSTWIFGIAWVCMAVLTVLLRL